MEEDLLKALFPLSYGNEQGQDEKFSIFKTE